MALCKLLDRLPPRINPQEAIKQTLKPLLIRQLGTLPCAGNKALGLPTMSPAELQQLLPV